MVDLDQRQFYIAAFKLSSVSKKGVINLLVSKHWG